MYPNEYHHDKGLSNGPSYPCALFESFSAALHCIIVNNLNIPGCAHMLDNFLFVSLSKYDRVC